MLVDLPKLASNALSNAIADQNVANEARSHDREAFFNSAAEAAQANIGAADEETRKQLTVAVETLKQEDHDDQRAKDTLARSVKAALAKLTDLASL